MERWGGKMLTKEECTKALNALYFSNGKDGRDDEFYDVLLELINEHFDNPPLSFEEMKEGDWVWDNKRKEWCVLAAFWKDALNRYYVSGLSDSPFEENRFYRKQVKE